jgi:hypothetical protein
MFVNTRQRLARPVLVLTLTFVLVALLTSIVSAQGRVVNRVNVGGPDACVAFGASHPGCDGNFSLVAHQYEDGSISGQWTDRFATGAGFHAVIDCLVVDGNEAWISGVITQGTWDGESLVGEPVSTRVQDNGRSARDPVDQISYSWIGEGWAFSCDEQTDYDLLDMPEGQVTVD